MTGIHSEDFELEDETAVLRGFFEQVAREATTLHPCDVCLAPDAERTEELTTLVNDTRAKLDRIREISG